MPSSYRFVVRGQVQGVGFRFSAVAQARRWRLSGWIANRSDGAVEGLASGEADELAALRAWLERGPPAARVETVEWTESAERAGPGFTIQPG